MLQEPDILVAARPGTVNKPEKLAAPWRPRTASLTELLKGRVAPAQITIVDIDSQKELDLLETLAVTLKHQLQAAEPSYVILSLNLPENIEDKARIFHFFDVPDRVELTDGRDQVPALLENIVAKLHALSERKTRSTASVSKPRPSPLDSVKEVVKSTGRLRGPHGKLSAEAIARLYGISVAQLANWLGRSRQTVSRTPDAESLQDKLGFFERVARLLAVLNEEDFRRWLRMPNPNLNNETPLSWLASKRWQPLADLTDDMLTGAPT
jgi:antitoxin Xre/MbcA/ParS-like protein